MEAKWFLSDKELDLTDEQKRRFAYLSLVDCWLAEAKQVRRYLISYGCDPASLDEWFEKQRAAIEKAAAIQAEKLWPRE